MTKPNKSPGVSEGNGQTVSAPIMYGGQPIHTPEPWVRRSGPSKWTVDQLQPSRIGSLLELGTTLTGLGLTVFMMLHLAMLSSVLFGMQTMDTLANFLEKYYLLQAGIPPLLIGLLGHIFLSLRKVPTTAMQQRVLLREIRWIRHFDTWSWVFQIVSGGIILALVAIHLWVVLTDLPIGALRSGTRVFGIYLWFYIPFILVVEAHTSLGLYRASVKWGMFTRRYAHLWVTLWTVAVLALGTAVLATLYGIGAQP